MIARAPNDFIKILNMGMRLEEGVREGKLSREEVSTGKKYGSGFSKKRMEKLIQWLWRAEGSLMWRRVLDLINNIIKCLLLFQCLPIIMSFNQQQFNLKNNNNNNNVLITTIIITKIIAIISTTTMRGRRSHLILFWCHMPNYIRLLLSRIWFTQKVLRLCLNLYCGGISLINIVPIIKENQTMILRTVIR